MGSWGAIIMGFFGGLFAAMTLYWQWHFAGPILAVPFIVSAVIGLAAVAILRMPGSGVVPSEKAARAIQWSSIAEGIGLFLASNIVINLHRPDLLLPAMALVVGLHFLPIAFAAAFRPFYILGVALILAAVIGSISAPNGGTIAGFTAAACLWIAAILAVFRDQRAKRGA
ncbi:MFS family permease [Sphingomonas vulcanisoli]|uniref:MFS family permease n=1 Tax=Sphingomonas vulcanisoli TaxID=1658060 RepID=A0ABX0TLT4_9SPHN|nr:hypothetical protein [Sphingomonas vulcanisoli]NIJ06466.1 MFS family permease [Sphingomonas vulcanisoli]